ncbi:ABC transporter substrate-binding protein [Thalassobacter stenotrophicus]|uniref:Maltose-binding periplasmic proteins/domains n=2 Tax=Thalassobacter stenotrophicus TaxID=266809 RepID=A0A0N7LTZ7_9RHOB|nr:extracellular solute-binding protein [Thalassobacter stenotrophicus]PVZ48935.1 ABC transporter substrate-binding protein [Thalassobacter stenotrophicus]CUH62090.1 Maltose-binding periplasmic proteins/domains [Thalassobacter stenotrophicus]SHI35125.1 carbohydrate ABC transporter substrate-binding protein, CUT1 family [Thalassobacter stenotrophicus DSM 16310]
MFIKKIALAGAVSLFASGAAVACSYENTVPLKSLTAGFEAWKAVTDAMAACGNFEPELDQEFRTKQPAAFAANPSLYHIGGVSNGTVTPLLNEGTIRPLDDLVAKYGQNLSPNQLIRVDGQIMAIAMMVNTQHMMYRSDIFADLGLEAPATYDDVLAAAEAIKDAGVVDYPLGATMKSGWNLAQDFNNMFLGFGGTFYGDDSMPMVNSEAGINTLEMMQKLAVYMDPEFLVSDSTYVQQQFQQGKIAMANLWASRGGAMNDAAESSVVGKVGSSAAPLAMAGGAPATTLWWDGLVIAANISDEEADAAFRLAMEGLTTDMVQANNDAAIWLVNGYQPSDMAAGAIATATAAPAPAPYPSTSQMGLMHTALGNVLPAFFTGEMSAEDALAAVEDAYKTAAEEAGLL